MKILKCVFCGKDEHLVDYEKGFYDCEDCNKKFYVEVLK